MTKEDFEILDQTYKTLSQTAIKSLWLDTIIATETVVDGISQITRTFRYTLGDRLLDKCLNLSSAVAEMTEFEFSIEQYKKCRVLLKEIEALLNLCFSKKIMPVSKHAMIAQAIKKVEDYLK